MDGRRGREKEGKSFLSPVWTTTLEGENGKQNKKCVWLEREGDRMERRAEVPSSSLSFHFQPYFLSIIPSHHFFFPSFPPSFSSLPLPFHPSPSIQTWQSQSGIVGIYKDRVMDFKAKESDIKSVFKIN